MRRFFVVLLLAASLVGSARAQTAAPASSRLLPLDTARIDSVIQAEMATRQLVGLSIGFLQDGHTVLRTYGFANRAAGTRVDTTTRFGIGSVTKQFTCAIVLQLAAEGRLSLDDPVAKYFPDLTRARDITLRDLMGHVAGYPDYYPLDFVDRRLARPIATDSVIRWYGRQPLDFEPGTRWSYSNTGFIMLSRIAERVTGRPFGRLLRERIFEPLEMRNTSYEPARRGRGYAQGYAAFALGDPEPVNLEATGWLGGAGGIFSTPADLLRWDRALMGGRVVGAEYLRQMTTSRILRNGASTGYGYGIGVGMAGGDSIWAHGGGLSGFRAQNMMVPAVGAALVVLSNNEGMPNSNVLMRMSVRFLPPPRDSTARAPVADATPVPEIRGTAAAAQATDLLHQMQAGRVDRSRLGEEFSFWLTDARLQGAAARLAALGEPTGTEQTTRVERGGMEVTVTRFTFGTRSVTALMYRTPDGLVQEYLLSGL